MKKRNNVAKRILAVALTLFMTVTSLPNAAVLATEVADSTSGSTETATESTTTTTTYDVDVWDFAGDQFEGVNNMLTKDIINSWYPGVEAGSTGVNLASFTVEDDDGNTLLAFNDGGKSNTHRLRVNKTVTGVTCYDTGKYLKDADGNVVCNGYIYSNSAASDAVNVQIAVQAGDKVTVYVGSNTSESTIVFKEANSSQTFENTPGGSVVGIHTFYATENGLAKIYASKEKLCVGRIKVEHCPAVVVSGTVTGLEEVENASVVFTNQSSGVVTAATIKDGTYSVDLNTKYDYAVSLSGANGYIIASDKTLSLAAGASDTTFDVEAVSVDLAEGSGTVNGIPTEILANATFTFSAEGKIYVPEFTIDGTSFSGKFEKDVDYTVSVSGVDDYTLNTTTVNASTNEIVFEAKPTYKVTIAPTGAELSDLANATFTFTRHSDADKTQEEAYVYTFTGTDNIALRDGIYTVKVTGADATQKLTSNLTVNGADVTKTVPFTKAAQTSWSFTSAEYTGQASYQGLTIVNGKKHGTEYGMTNTNGSITVPVSGPCTITVGVGYTWDISCGETSYVQTSNGGKTTVDFAYTGAAGTVTLTTGSSASSYISSISVKATAATQVTEDFTITVGATNCDYTTINDALDAIRAMDRADGVRATISIQPGNYEEMLDIDIPNVTLKNASATPSIATKNAGVDIDENAVRITWYYGHGYTYYSMGSDCKYDADILAVNKENGYASFTNPGSGTTNGSYWNATVTVQASGFEADGIIFENSFNQYVSAASVNDVIEKQSSAKEGSVARATMKTVGDTTVQNKQYVERAAALAIYDKQTEISFNNCKFIGRQDTLYGGKGSTAAFYACDIYGGTDYIFGGMTAVFAKCNLVANTSEDSNDVFYITAPQQESGRGYLMYNCNVVSTTPGVDTASTKTSKAGYFGRPWQATTSEVVFYATNIADSCNSSYDSHESLIVAAGWLDTLSGTSDNVYEFGSNEMTGVDNSASRVSWAKTYASTEDATLADGTAVSVAAFLGDWDAFAGKDMTIVTKDAITYEKPAVETAKTTYTLDVSSLTATSDKEAVAEGTKLANNFVTSCGKVTKRISSTTGKVTSIELDKAEGGYLEFKVEYLANAVISVSSTGGSNESAVALAKVDGTTETIIENEEKVSVVKGTSATTLTYKNLQPGTYRIVSPADSARGRGVRVLGAEIIDEKVIEKVVSTKTLDVSSLTATADKETIAEGTKLASNFVTSYGKVTKRISSTTGNVTSIELDKAESGYLEFKVEYLANAEISVSSTGGSNESAVALAKVDGTTEATIENEEKVSVVKGTSATTLTYKNLQPGTYRIVSPVDSARNRGVRVLGATFTVTTISGDTVVRKAWSEVTAPVITSAEQQNGTIVVSADMVIGDDGADKAIVTMTAENGKTTDIINAKEGTTATYTFSPAASGKYTFSVKATRADETTELVGAETKTVDFVLPLGTTSITSATNQGDGVVELEWAAVAEATGYTVTATSTTAETVTATVEGTTTTLKLVAGNAYSVTIQALRGEEVGAVGSATTVNAKATSERKWSFSAYGSSTDTAHNGFSGNINDGSVTVYSENGKGKLVPNSTDGLAFYYTTIDPDTENFTLSADITVDKWTFSNGQEGFGIMASDTIGVNGSSETVWNNSIMGVASKVEYYYSNGEVTTDTTASKITMKLGIGTLARLGVTAADVASFKSTGLFADADGNATASVPLGFTTETTTLETSCGVNGTGTYNVIGNATSAVAGTIAEPVTTLHLTLQRNNTGYIVTYSDADGNVLGQKLIYDDEDNLLTQIDPDHIYVGFFASRNARITVTNMKLTTIAPADDAAKQEHTIETVSYNGGIESATVSNSADYNLVYYGNADGTLTITDANGNSVLADGAASAKITAKTKYTVPTTLTLGNNVFTVSFTPDADYTPGKYKVLDSYDTVTSTFTVSYKQFSGDLIYVSPNATASGTGSKNYPTTIYNAVKYVAPGQKIVLMEGTYSLSSTVKVERGIDGTADAMIYMVADPEATTRPVLDFNEKCAGMVLAGNYWYFQGFDVTRSSNGQKGIQVSGNNNVLDDIRTYKNGNTGIQIARYLTSDATKADWPQNNLIKNCTSFLNADAGYEDADGFAAKLTIGDGNVFDGCVAAYNADDGWDCFAKAETGCIGKVTIKNSIAFKNGYILDDNGNEVNAGNGNGFKMGGESLSGHHTLINSIAFGNKAKGIDSNSCPDIEVYNSISFDNESYNVAFYTNNAVNTAYVAQNIISYKKSNTTDEQIKLKGTQDETQVRNATNFFYEAGVSQNTAGTTVTDDWFTNLDMTSVVSHAVSQILAGTFGLAGADETTGVARNTDGTLTTNGFLTLTSAAPAASTESATAYAGLYATTAIADSASATVEVSGTTPADPSIQTQIQEKVQEVANNVKVTVQNVVDTVKNTLKNIVNRIFGKKKAAANNNVTVTENNTDDKTSISDSTTPKASATEASSNEAETKDATIADEATAQAAVAHKGLGPVWIAVICLAAAAVLAGGVTIFRKKEQD